MSCQSGSSIRARQLHDSSKFIVLEHLMPHVHCTSTYSGSSSISIVLQTLTYNISCPMSVVLGLTAAHPPSPLYLHFNLQHLMPNVHCTQTYSISHPCPLYLFLHLTSHFHCTRTYSISHSMSIALGLTASHTLCPLYLDLQHLTPSHGDPNFQINSPSIKLSLKQLRYNMGF